MEIHVLQGMCEGHWAVVKEIYIDIQNDIWIFGVKGANGKNRNDSFQ